MARYGHPYMYLYALFALFSRFGQSMVDTKCLHNNTSKDRNQFSPKLSPAQPED